MKKVIIVGASYAGLTALKELKNEKNLEILIFDKNSYHFLQVESYGLASSIYEENDVLIDIKKYISKIDSNVRFIQEEISFFDSQKKIVSLKNDKKYSFDYLIIATGAKTNFPKQVPNLQKYSKTIKSLNKANSIKEEFNNILKLAKNDKTSKKYNIVVGGAGLSGVELVCEMANLINKENKFQNINISLIEGLSTVLSNMEESLINSCEKRIKDLGINLYVNSFIKDIDERSIFLQDGRTIIYDSFIFTGGIKAVTLNSTKEYEKNKSNQYVTDNFLRLKTEEDIFVIGDASEIIYNKKYIAPTAQNAVQSAIFVALYIKNKNKHSLEPIYEPKSNGVLIALGGKYAIGLLFDKYFINGYIAYLIKKFVTSSHKKRFS